MIRTAAQTAQTLNEFQENLFELLPRDVYPYVQQSLHNPLLLVPTPDHAIEVLSLRIAQNIMWAFLFFLIWTILSILIKGFLGLIMFRRDGNTWLGVFDGILGMASMTMIVVMALIGISGFVFPFAVLSKPDGSIAQVYPYFMQSRLFQWMIGIYHQSVA